jgi:hypothetical protein
MTLKGKVVLEIIEIKNACLRNYLSFIVRSSKLPNEFNNENLTVSNLQFIVPKKWVKLRIVSLSIIFEDPCEHLCECAAVLQRCPIVLEVDGLATVLEVKLKRIVDMALNRREMS